MKRLPVRLLTLLLVLSTSCVLHGPESLRRDLEQASGIEVKREAGLTVGRMGTTLVRWLTPQDEVPLRGVRKVQLGVYRVVHRPDGSDLQIGLPALAGWQRVVRVREGEERVDLLVMEVGSQIRGLLVVVAEDDEWVLVRIRGKLDHVMEQVMRMAFEKADHPELYEPALAEYRRGADRQPEQVSRDG